MRLSRPLALLALLGPGPALAAQSSAGTELWRLATVTLPLPPALATGVVAAFWNPAQPTGPGAGQLGLELIQTPGAVDARGVIAAVRFRLRRMGSLGFVYGRMELSDLVRTTDSPSPDGSTIPFYTQSAALAWARDFSRSTVGVNIGYHDTHFDNTRIGRWVFDAGFAQRVGERVRLAAAFRGFQRLGSDPAQDLYAGFEYRLWRGALWHGTPGVIQVRYGLTTGHPGGTDHQLGLGLDVAAPLSLDVVLVREATYGNAAWRGAAGFRIAVGRYRLCFARDGGISDLGSSFRVGLEARVK